MTVNNEHLTQVDLYRDLASYNLHMASLAAVRAANASTKTLASLYRDDEITYLSLAQYYDHAVRTIEQEG